MAGKHPEGQHQRQRADPLVPDDPRPRKTQRGNTQTARKGSGRRPSKAEVGKLAERPQKEIPDEGDSTTGEPERKIGFDLHATDASLNSLKLLNRHQWWFL